MKSALAIEGGLLKKILALALVASLYMMFVLPMASAASPYQVSGQLVSTGNVVINSAEVSNGATVLSGSRITVKAPVQATINLGSLGKVDALPNTDFELTFTGSSVIIKLNYGTVTLTTQSGISGEVTSPCSGVRIQVAQGNVSVKSSDKTENLTAGKSERASQPDATTSGGSTFTANAGACGGGPANGTGGQTGGTAGAGGAGGSSLPSALTIAIIGGSVAAAVGAGIALGGRPNNVSPA
jgi:hypothetical protein